MSGGYKLQCRQNCYVDKPLSDSLHQWIYESQDISHLTEDLLKQLLSLKSSHCNCADLQHEAKTQKICTLLTKDLMTSILSCSADSNDITPVLKFMMEGSGHLILKCLLKFGTKTVGCKEDLFKLLWHWLQSKRTIDMAELDPLVYNGVCGVCVQLIADLCEMDSHSSRVKLASDALPEFTVFITNLLLLREDDPRCNSSKLTDERSSLDSLMLQTVQAYCRVTSLICSSRLVEEHSVMVIISEVALVYSDVATCSSSTISVVSACLVGLLQVLESLCTKLHSLAHTIAMSADVLQLLSSLLPGHMSQLIAAGQEELMKQTASSLVSAIKQMKEGKVKHIHNLRCLRKKHRHCDLISNFHHHDDILSVEVFAKQECAVACLSRLLLNLYQILPQSFAIKMEILEWLTENSGCCCMAQVDFIVPLLSANLGDYSEQILHSILSSLTSLILHQLSGQATSKTPSCERCSPESLKHVEDMAGMSILQELVVSINNEERRKIILQHLCTMIGQCNSQLVFLLYRHVFKPILDLFYSDKSAVSMECIKTCLSAFIHSLTEDDCIDHFLSSAYSMKALELCVAEYNTLLPLVLQVLSLLIQLRSEEQVLTPLLTIILGEPGVQAPNSDFVMIELIYETPDFSAPISEKQMMLTNEKWTCCHRLLQQSSLFRSGFQSQSGVQLSLDVMGSIIPTLILENSLSSTQRHFLLQLLPTAIGCLQLSVHHQLTIGKAVFTIENLCSEIFKILQRCDFDSDREVSNERVFHILRLLLACSSHTLPARGTHRLCSQNDPEDFSLSQEEGSGKGDNSTKREERVSSSDRGASSSSDEYEADDESYVESSTPERCSFYDNLIQPEFWMLTFDLMTLETVSLTQSQISTLILDMDRLMHSVDSWQFLQHKAALVLKLLERYQQEVIDECDPLAGLVLSLVEYVSYLDMNSGILFKMLSLLKESCFKSHLLASVHTVITQSKCMPCSSIAFPLDRNDKERDIGVIVSQIDKFGTQPLSVILWLYLDGSISTGYNSQYKSKQPVQLMSITRSQLTITLQSEVTNGNICLLIGNLAGDVIGRVPVPSVLTTNKWQMVSFMADIKTKENLSLYVQFSLGVDGREIRAGTEAFTAPSKVIFDDQSNLDLHVGQRSNLYVKKESVHLAHTLIFTGCLTGLQCAELYSLGPSFNTFSRCIADIDAPLMDRRPLLCRRLPPSALQHLKSFSTSRLKQTLQALVTVIGPEYKPCCLFYNLYPLTSGDKFLSVANTKNRLLSFVSRVEEQPAAYYGQLSVVKHTGLEEAMANLGGSNLLLYMYAQCVELRLDESSQRLALECLLHSCTQSADLPLATQKPLDYKLLSKILHTEQCLVTPAITKVLINYAMRHVEADVLLVDMQFIEEVLLDWLIWQSRPQSWKPIWTALCQSVSAQNRFRQSNCMALLECEIPQTAVRIPSVQFQKNSDYSLSAWFTSQLALMVYRTLQCTHDKKLIQDICMHLLLLHPAAATFIEYDRSKLYPSTHWSTQLSSLRSNASSTLSLYRQTSDMSDTESICGLDDSDTFFSAKDETDDSKEGYTSEEGMSDQSTETLTGSTVTRTSSAELSDNVPSSASSLQHHLKKVYRRSDAEITSIPENVEEGEDAQNLEAVSEEMEVNSEVDRMETEEEVEFETEACDLEARTLAEELVRREMESVDRDVESKRRHVVVDSEQVILAETNSEVDFKRDGEVSPLLSVTDTNFSLTDRSISPPFNNNLLLQQTLPSSPTFDLVDIPVPDRPDIIASHDDYEPLDKTMDDRALSQLSANLLHMLFLLSNDLTATDKRIFCSDLMTLDTLTVFLNHEDVNVVYTAFKLLSRVIEMSSTEDIEAFVNRRGFHLVATQLNKVIASDKLVNICALLVNGQSCSAMCKDEFSNPFILPLIGILEKCCHDLTLCSKAFSLLFQIFEERVSSLGYAVRNGFVQVLSNCLMALNDHHPYMDSDDMDNLLAYMHTFLQKIANYVVIYGKNESKTDQIKSLLCPFMLLERRERREQRGSYAVSRVETAISLIYQELYTSIKQEAMARPLALLQRILSRGSIPEPNRGLEDSANFSIKRISLGGGNQSLTASMTSLHHLATDSGDSKNTKNSLAEMLLCTLKDFFCYSLYRVSSAKKCSETLTSVVELLVDTLIVQEDSGVKKSLWTSIVESEKLRATVWKLLTEMITFMLSPSCDQISAESIIAVFGLLPDTSQKKIVDNLTPNDFLLPNLRRFLQVNFLKDVSESFLRRILNKRSAFLLRSTSAPTLPVPEKTESNIQSLWLTSYMRDRKIWKRQLAERKQRVIKATERLVKDLRNAAMEVNRDVVNRQNMQRKRFIELMKIHIATEVSVRKQWQRIIEQFTHERAVWTDPSRFPQSWEMDPTEGPGRVRKRLQRCHLLNIAPKFLLGEYKYKLELPKSGPPLQFLFEELRQNESASADVICRLHTNETINFTCKCSNVTPSTEIHGELLISDDCIHFVGDDAISDYSKTVFSERQELLFIRWPCNEIKCFYKRRYQLQDNALEIFLTSGRASLFAVDSTKERDVLWDTLNKLPLPNLTSSADLDSIQKQWLSGHMSNFDYLTHLNTLAGRSFNDLMQYPVFPFVLNNYDSSFLDIDDPENYRKLNKPIASQLPENEAKFKQHYEAIEADIERSKRFPDSSHISLAPYHYASHYSNSGVVLHYLIRLLPYSHMFLKYQDGQFDIPDRTFHSMQTSWLLSSERSSTDVKELIPEFFYLPEFLVNYEGFDFGKRQNKAQVNDLNLPDWCKQDNRLFVMVLRQALENSIVTSNLQNWINLIFGYQQQGEAARAAVNKFHPATYYGLEVNSIEDELQQSAIKVMIRTYGQMPKQLFTSKHPEQLPQLTQEHRLGFDIPVLDTVAGLKWGDYLGSPADAVEPKVIVNELMGAQRVVAITTEEVFSLGSSSSVITHETKSGGELSSKTDSLWAARLTWNHPDNVLRLQTQKNKQSINFLSLPYKVTACSSLTDSGLLFIASVSGIIQVHRIQYSKQKLCELAWVGLEVTLIGHRSPITSLVVCKEYSIVVSADESGLCIIWDLNKLSYVRCIQNETKSRIDCVAVSPTLGDIAFCSPHGSGSVLEVFTVNAQPVARLTLTHTIAWLCYSAAPEGLSVNALVGALSDATIQFWSSWDLKPIRTLSVNGMDEPFICCTFTPDNQRLAANTDKGRIIVWDKPRVGMQGIVRCLPAD